MIIEYCETALKALENPRSGLKEQLGVLLDEKYDEPGSADTAFNTAKNLVIRDINRMCEKAEEQKSNVATLQSDLTKVYSYRFLMSAIR